METLGYGNEKIGESNQAVTIPDIKEWNVTSTRVTSTHVTSDNGYGLRNVIGFGCGLVRSWMDSWDWGKVGRLKVV